MSTHTWTRVMSSLVPHNMTAPRGAGIFLLSGGEPRGEISKNYWHHASQLVNITAPLSSPFEGMDFPLIFGGTDRLYRLYCDIRKRTLRPFLMRFIWQFCCFCSRYCSCTTFTQGPRGPRARSWTSYSENRAGLRRNRWFCDAPVSKVPKAKFGQNSWS